MFAAVNSDERLVTLVAVLIEAAIVLLVLYALAGVLVAAAAFLTRRDRLVRAARRWPGGPGRLYRAMFRSNYDRKGKRGTLAVCGVIGLALLMDAAYTWLLSGRHASYDPAIAVPLLLGLLSVAAALLLRGERSMVDDRSQPVLFEAFIASLMIVTLGSIVGAFFLLVEAGVLLLIDAVGL